jgi:hypothetical protein
MRLRSIKEKIIRERGHMGINSQLPEKGIADTLTERIRDLLNDYLRGYEKEPILRALVQLLFPFGGPADFLLSWKATNSYQERVLELFENVVRGVSNLEEQTLNKEFLYSEKFLELLGTCVETVARAASEKKRGYVAAFLTGTIKQGQTHNLSQQIAEDLRVLQDFHLRVLASLPDSLKPNILAPDRTSDRVIDLHKLRDIAGMDWAIFNKGACIEQLKGIRLFQCPSV